MFSKASLLESSITWAFAAKGWRSAKGKGVRFTSSPFLQHSEADRFGPINGWVLLTSGPTRYVDGREGLALQGLPLKPQTASRWGLRDQASDL